MNKDDKDLVNVWDIIDTYFRDTPYYRSATSIIDCHLMNLFFRRKWY